MENIERPSDRLARYIIYCAAAVAIGTVCWFFRDVIIYILLAAILSMIGHPLMEMLKKIRIKRKSIPDWCCAILSIALLLIAFFCILFLIFPIIASVFKDISMVNVGNTVKDISVPLQDFNSFMTDKFPNLGSDFKIENVILEQLQKLINVTMFSSILSSVTSFLTSFGVGLFSVVFISFFFFKNGHLFSKIILSLVPDKYENDAEKSIADINHLLSRYFIGLTTEVLGVATLNFLGLFLIAKLGFNASIGIAFITGIMNIIPYVGPLTGGAIGTILAIIMKYVCATNIGLDVSFWIFIAIIIAIFCITQLIDNFLFQPFIYSSSIKAHPLEIFIVLLMAGHIGGILGMLIAIPSYTCLRVIAGRFFHNIKFIRNLIGNPEN